MTRIKFGSQHDDSVAHHEITSDGGSSEISFGDQYDRSSLTSKILDLKDPKDLKLLAGQLSTLSQGLASTPEGKANPGDVKALDEAAQHAAAGNGERALACLKTVGKWVLTTATAVGTPVAIDVLKAWLI